MVTLILIAVLTGVLLVLRVKSSPIHRNGERLPRPPGTLPFFGNGLLFLQSRNKLFHWFTERERQYGKETFEISVPTLPPGIVINDPDSLEYVLKHDDLFTKGDFFRQRSMDLFGHGIINVDGMAWKRQRKSAVRFFNNANLKTLVDVFLPRFICDVKRDLHLKAQSQKPLDLEVVFTDLTTRIMGVLAYDMDMQASSSFFHAFEFASSATGRRFQNPLWKFTESLFGGQLRRALAEVKEFGRSVVATAIENSSSGVERSSHFTDFHGLGGEKKLNRSGDGVEGSLIQYLLDGIGDASIVADAALNFLSAGRDTTAQALTWTFYLLMQHQDVVRQIRDELNDLVLDGKGLSLPCEKIQSSSLPYTMATFYESLRLYPPVPFEIKQCEKAVTLPDGTFLPKDAVVVWCPWAMSRSKHTWGPDPHSFRPERWLGDDSDGNEGMTKRVKKVFIPKTAFEFPVFNGGPRSCLGKRMAELQAVYTIASLVWEFDFFEVRRSGLKAGEPQKERVSRNSLTLPMEGGLPCHVVDRPHTQAIFD